MSQGIAFSKRALNPRTDTRLLNRPQAFTAAYVTTPLALGRLPASSTDDLFGYCMDLGDPCMHADDCMPALDAYGESRHA